MNSDPRRYECTCSLHADGIDVPFCTGCQNLFLDDMDTKYVTSTDKFDISSEAIDLIKENFLSRTDPTFPSNAPYVYSVYGSEKPPNIPGASWDWATSNHLKIIWDSREAMIEAWRALDLI